jgi:hypothetical protein
MDGEKYLVGMKLCLEVVVDTGVIDFWKYGDIAGGS